VREAEPDLDNARAAMDWSLANGAGLAVELARAQGDSQALARALCLVATRRDPQAAAESIQTYHRGDMARCRETTQRQLLLAEAAGSAVNLNAARGHLADLELAAGRPAEAVRLGRELVARWLGSRNMRALASARLNLANALLACDDVAAARSLAVEAWPTAGTWLLQPYWGLVLALLAALEGRLEAAAALLGYAEHGLRQRGERLEPNEARTRARAEELAAKALGEEAIAAGRRTGALLSDAQAGRLGLEREDGAGLPR
jgi:hypothetical protein